MNALCALLCADHYKLWFCFARTRNFLPNQKSKAETFSRNHNVEIFQIGLYLCSSISTLFKIATLESRIDAHFYANSGTILKTYVHLPDDFIC